ncbi:MAG: asparagine synthase (glutamine-hydrolyzing) [Nitrospira sp.]|nr:MAG: asparagine synthase (glutamine-hydrolyzing) [Nitrospira sp.]
MCGIAGKIRFDGRPILRELLESMCNALHHRGPDAANYHFEPGVGLGQRRLSVIDLSDAATPPLANETNRIWVVFNGEIYNFRALRQELEGKGHTFRTETDTEVIIHLYEEYDVECVQKLHGMFALALWDADRRRLIAARDRLGKKPFYYASTTQGIVFASSLEALLHDNEVSREPNFFAIDQFLDRQYVPSPLTAFRSIRKLEPGHILICEPGGRCETRRFWAATPRLVTQASECELQEELVRLTREAVRMRMISDVPLGALLSGGIDSGTIVALMAQESSSSIKTFSIGLEETDMDELPYARLVAKRYETDHMELVLKPDVIDILPKLIRYYGEPFADSSAVPTYCVSKLARQFVTVALSGDGGDENFGGYTHYGQTLAWEHLDVIPHFLRDAVLAPVEGALSTFPFTDTMSRCARACMMARSRLPGRYMTQTAIFKPQEKQAILTSRFRALVNDSKNGDTGPTLPWQATDDSLDWMIRHDLRYYLPDCLMVKVDVAAMANSLEVRSPLLDHHLVEFALTIPAKLKRSAGQGKSIMRKAFANLLPQEILNKPKTGFGIPLRKWLQVDLAAMMKSVLLDDRAVRRGLLEQRFVRQMVQSHLAGDRDWSTRLWAMIVLELWFREFID